MQIGVNMSHPRGENGSAQNFSNNAILMKCGMWESLMDPSSPIWSIRCVILKENKFLADL